jgi:hypothetical protein
MQGIGLAFPRSQYDLIDASIAKVSETKDWPNPRESISCNKCPGLLQP